MQQDSTHPPGPTTRACLGKKIYDSHPRALGFCSRPPRRCPTSTRHRRQPPRTLTRPQRYPHSPCTPRRPISTQHLRHQLRLPRSRCTRRPPSRATPHPLWRPPTLPSLPRSQQETKQLSLSSSPPSRCCLPLLKPCGFCFCHARPPPLLISSRTVRTVS